MTKEAFPGLLAKLCNKICPDDSPNASMISGFRKTGIYPLNPEEVFQRLPENKAEDFTAVVSDSLIELLKEMRGVNEQHQPVKRKK